MAAVPAPRVQLLDGFAVHLDGRSAGSRTADNLPRGVQRLVALVALRGRPTRAAVAGELWPDVPEEQAHSSLRSALWRLHKAAPRLVVPAGGGLRFADDVVVDVRELSTWAELVLDPQTSTGSAPGWDPALRGELLPGWYEDWVLLERDRLRQLRLLALEAWADRLTRAGRHAEALQAAYCAVRDGPLRESAHRAVVRAHLAQGNVVEAVRAYDSFSTMLAAELGVPPTAQMNALLAFLRTDGERRERVARRRPS